MPTLSLHTLGVLSGVCLILGSVLDWSGVAYSSTTDRRLAFAAGALVLLLVVVAHLWRARVLALALAPGVVGLNMAIVNYVDIDGRLHEYAAYPEASVGVGVYLVGVGGGLALVVGVVSAFPRRWLEPAERRPLDS